MTNQLSCENCVHEKIVHKGTFDIFLECQDCLRGCVQNSNECCISPDHIFVNMPRKDGAPTKRQYCKNCFNVSGLVKMDHPLQFKDYPVLTRDDADEKQKIRFDKQQKFFTYLRDKKQKRFDDQVSEDKQYYNEVYLNSAEWKDKRIRVLNRDKYICQGCLSNKATQVHHLTYERIYKEPLFDLISVCENCHKSIHEI